MYAAVKEHLLGSGETMGEKQIRVAREWAGMSKPKHMSAIQFQSNFFKIVKEQNPVGLCKESSGILHWLFGKTGAYIEQGGPDGLPQLAWGL